MVSHLFLYLGVFLVLLVLVYLLLYVRSLVVSYRVYSLYLNSSSISKEVRREDKSSWLPLFLYPRYPISLVRRILELEDMYDFIEELGLDLSSIRRDYFSRIRGELSAEVVPIEVRKS